MALLLLVGASVAARGQATEAVLDAAYELGQEAFDTYAPSSIKEEYAWPDRETWSGVVGRLGQALQGTSLNALAGLRQEVAGSLAQMDATPALQPYADWLRQRLDYFDMAEHVIKTFPAPESPPSGPAKPPPRAPSPEAAKPRSDLEKPARPPPPPSGGRQAKAARNRVVWEQKLRKRSEPAGAAALVPRLKTIFDAEGVPPELVWLAEVESTFNPQARSPVGAAGLYQFMPATAERFGLKTRPVDERLEPEKSARAAAQYLRILYRRFDSWPLALAAYNAGEGRVGKALKVHGGNTFEHIADHLPAETQMYVPKVLAVVSLREKVDPDDLPPPRT